MTTLPHFTRASLLTATPNYFAFCGSQDESRMLGHSRVKRETYCETHVKARLCDSVGPERGANKGDNGMGFTPKLPRGDL